MCSKSSISWWFTLYTLCYKVWQEAVFIGSHQKRKLKNSCWSPDVTSYLWSLVLLHQKSDVGLILWGWRVVFAAKISQYSVSTFYQRDDLVPALQLHGGEAPPVLQEHAHNRHEAEPARCHLVYVYKIRHAPAAAGHYLRHSDIESNLVNANIEEVNIATWMFCWFESANWFVLKVPMLLNSMKTRAYAKENLLFGTPWNWYLKITRVIDLKKPS